MIDFVDANGGKANGSGDLVPENGRARITKVGVNQLAGDDAVTEESLAVGQVRVREAGVGGRIIPKMDVRTRGDSGQRDAPSAFGELLLGEFLELPRLYFRKG